jgi:hypothetical protein
MDRENLENKCIKLFEEENGRKLFRAIVEIANKDFCVATAWNDHQVSIAKTCSYRGKIFELTPDYKSLILNGDEIIPLEELSYQRIERHLAKKSYGHLKHCEFDLSKK